MDVLADRLRPPGAPRPRPRRMSFGCGLVYRIRSIPSTPSISLEQAGEARRPAPPRSRPYELTFCPSSVTSADPVGGQAARLGHELARRTRHLPPPGRRDDAVAADRVAPDRDLHPRLERPLPLGRQPARESPRTRRSPARSASSLTRNSASLWTCPGPRATSTNGNGRKISSLTDCAQHPPDRRRRAPGRAAFEALGLAQMRQEATVGRLTDRARVEQDQIGLRPRLRLRRSPIDSSSPFIRSESVHVHLAAERRQAIAHRQPTDPPAIPRQPTPPAPRAAISGRR